MLTQPQQTFIVNLRQNAEALARAILAAQDLVSVFEDRDYGELGTVTDEDLLPFDLTLADVGAYINALQQLLNWRDGQAVTQGEHGAAVNKVRQLTF
jgi:hypothetical protein